jgi:hypothetical protein
MNDINLDKIKVNYDKKDFLYYKYAYQGSKELYSCTPNSSKISEGTVLSETCKTFKLSAGPCSSQFTQNLCKNKTLADQMLKQTVNHSGADELYKNSTSKYNLERLNAFNLGMGVIASLIFIYRNK